VLIPISDDDRKLLKPAYVTWALVLLNIGVYVIQLSVPSFTVGYATIPAEITTGRDIVEPIEVQVSPGQVEPIPNAPGPKPIQLTLLTSMFMHAGLLHLAGNMLFLWIFGDNVEHRFGHRPFLLFYLGSGLMAAFAHIAMNSESLIPSLGASGAIAGVLGAYLVLYPRNRVYALMFVWIVTLPAFVVIVLWVIAQLMGGFQSLSSAPGAGGVAYAAHLGGFVAGVAMALYLRQRLQDEPASVFQHRYAMDPTVRKLW
jgi:membrane associated rhomboid family serine protease